MGKYKNKQVITVSIRNQKAREYLDNLHHGEQTVIINQLLNNLVASGVTKGAIIDGRFIISRTPIERQGVVNKRSAERTHKEYEYEMV